MPLDNVHASFLVVKGCQFERSELSETFERGLYARLKRTCDGPSKGGPPADPAPPRVLLPRAFVAACFFFLGRNLWAVLAQILPI